MLDPRTARPINRLLVVDDAKTSLGDLALQMVRLGIDVLHASLVDEAELLARQEGTAVRGVLMPSTSDVGDLDRMLESVGPYTGIAPEMIALVGPRADEARLDRLRARGMRFRLWSPFEDRDLRFLAWLVAWAGGDDDLRIHARVPTVLPAEVTRQGETRAMMVGDLSPAGAYLETDAPFPAGCRVNLEISLPSGPIRITGIVRWVADTRSRAPRVRPGFGVEFVHVRKEVRRELEEHLDAECERFAL